MEGVAAGGHATAVCSTPILDVLNPDPAWGSASGSGSGLGSASRSSPASGSALGLLCECWETVCFSDGGRYDFVFGFGFGFGFGFEFGIGLEGER